MDLLFNTETVVSPMISLALSIFSAFKPLFILIAGAFLGILFIEFIVGLAHYLAEMRHKFTPRETRERVSTHFRKVREKQKAEKEAKQYEVKEA